MRRVRARIGFRKRSAIWLGEAIMQIVGIGRLATKVSAYRKESDSRPVVKLRVMGPRGDALLSLSMSPAEAVELASDLADAAVAANELIAAGHPVPIRVHANDTGLGARCE